jgi:hypothetical protein
MFTLRAHVEINGAHVHNGAIKWSYDFPAFENKNMAKSDV